MPRPPLARALPAAVLALALGLPAQAHHSEAAEYDTEHLVKLTGTVSKVEWMNPHVWFYVDVTGADGKVTQWGFSTAPPGALMRRGVTKEALKPGSVVVVEGARARDGSNNASARRVSTVDGHDVLVPPAG